MAHTTFVTGGSGFLGRNLIAMLVQRGSAVRALARSAKARAAVESAGGVAVDGDLEHSAATVAAMRGCAAVIHCAALPEDWASKEAMWQANVIGTENMLRCAREAQVTRFVHTSTEAVLVDGTALVRVDEKKPLPDKPLGLYAITKGEAEKRVRAADAPGFAAVIVRPRFIWGNDDSTLLPKIIDEVNSGRFAWIGGGTNLMSTTHVDNACHGLIVAGERGVGGETYFVTDGDHISFRAMVEAMLRARGVAPPTRTIPRALAHGISIAGTAVASALGLARPMLPHATFHLLADEVTLLDDKARRELGYQNVISREQGLARMAQR
ncbi:MAG TPA: NAD-dependent epimerase/dehydratase family protein [Myxococcota bacterium]